MPFDPPVTRVTLPFIEENGVLSADSVARRLDMSALATEVRGEVCGRVTAWSALWRLQLAV